LSFKQALAESATFDVKLMPYENAEGMAFTRKCIGEIRPGAKVAVFIGPEGGFSEEEVKAASEMGFLPITLGRRILRTETAGMSVLSMISYALEN
jgi:16S rRNA (uracil1498-N3)-methyltransferase